MQPKNEIKTPVFASENPLKKTLEAEFEKFQNLSATKKNKADVRVQKTEIAIDGKKTRTRFTIEI